MIIVCCRHRLSTTACLRRLHAWRRPALYLRDVSQNRPILRQPQLLGVRWRTGTCREKGSRKRADDSYREEGSRKRADESCREIGSRKRALDSGRERGSRKRAVDSGSATTKLSMHMQLTYLNDSRCGFALFRDRV
jgi:hypothetical protein